MYNETHIGPKLTSSRNLLKQLFERFFSEQDLTFSQFRALEYLLQQPEGQTINQNAIGESLGIQPSSISSLLRTLEKKGYITRKKAFTDNRNNHIYLTQRARSMEALLEQAQLHAEEQMTRGLTEPELEVLRHALDRVIENLSEAHKRGDF